MSDVSLREYIERRFVDHALQHKQEDRARALANSVLDHRLEGLNALKQQYSEERQVYARRDLTDVLAAEIRQVNEKVQRIEGRFQALAITLSVVVAAAASISVVVSILAAVN